MDNESDYCPPFPSHWECPNCHEEIMADEIDANDWPNPVICNRCDVGAVMIAIYENHDE